MNSRPYFSVSPGKRQKFNVHPSVLAKTNGIMDITTGGGVTQNEYEMPKSRGKVPINLRKAR
jgi:hypothetical protein